VLYVILKRGAAIADRASCMSPRDAGDCGWFNDTPVGSPRQCADFAGQWRDELLASIWTSGLTECRLWVDTVEKVEN
jgi:hypothetical protein